MTAKKKAKKRLPKPVLAWCALYEGKIKPGWCCAHRDTTARWARNNPGGELVRVRITPVAKRRKGAWVPSGRDTSRTDTTLMEALRRSNEP